MAKAKILRPFILSWEGGYANVSGDSGGPTMKGVTIGTFRKVFGQNKTVEDLKNITDDQWLTIFKQYYWDKWKADEINSQSIANLLVDWVWGSGVHGIKNTQKILGVKIDGIVGKQTLGAINNYPNEHELFDRLWKEREDYFNRIAKGEKKKFLNGWMNRLRGIQYMKLVCNGKKTIYF